MKYRTLNGTGECCTLYIIVLYRYRSDTVNCGYLQSSLFVIILQFIILCIYRYNYELLWVYYTLRAIDCDER